MTPEHTKKEKKILRDFFVSKEWEVLIRPFREHVDNLTEIILMDDEMEQPERERMRQVCKIYKTILELPETILEETKTIQGEVEEMDPYEKPPEGNLTK